MKPYIFIVFIAFFICDNFTMIYCASHGRDATKQAFKQCSEIHQISEEIINGIRNRAHIPDDQELKCWLGCVFKKLGMMKGGKIDWASSVHFTNICHTGEQDPRKTDKMIQICKAEVAQDGIDECELAYSAAVCNIKTWKELGLLEENLDK
ncbi:unnamed protein product [Nezara viridula]|uniref:Uncharacterized protein n=1 Tax=Nezara viridula TaxID=85310 RepID=A0A9P0H2A8_NEZVI|nr:unnamed protein product [Nezara viridula]